MRHCQRRVIKHRVPAHWANLNPVILAFDTATALVSVAVWSDFEVLAHHEGQVAMKHGEQLGASIHQVLTEAGARPSDVTAIAVGVGPGPFTGLRVGLVTARTMGWALEIPVYGVCTLDVLAAQAMDQGLDEFVVATDARRKEVYAAHYRDGHRVAGPEVVAPADLATQLPVVGAGGRIYAEFFPGFVGIEQPAASVLAEVVAQERFELLDPEPMYLRRPDAMEPHTPKKVS